MGQNERGIINFHIFYYNRYKYKQQVVMDELTFEVNPFLEQNIWQHIIKRYQQIDRGLNRRILSFLNNRGSKTPSPWTYTESTQVDRVLERTPTSVQSSFLNENSSTDVRIYQTKVRLSVPGPYGGTYHHPKEVPLSRRFCLRCHKSIKLEPSLQGGENGKTNNLLSDPDRV